MKRLLDVPVWDGLSPEERGEVVSRLCDSLPGFRLEGIELHSQGDQSHHIAFLNRDDIRFALIPGAYATLGYDRENPWVPSPQELEDWERYREIGDYPWVPSHQEPEADDIFHDHGGDRRPPIEEFIRTYLTPLRRVRIDPFLIEVAPARLDERPLGETDPLFDRSLAGQLIPGVGGVARKSPGGIISYQLDKERVLHAIETRRVTYLDAVEHVTAGGFRLPTSDEWEYACSAGSRTLFRWGNRIPEIPEHPAPHPLAGRSPVDLHGDIMLLHEYLEYNEDDPMLQPASNPSLAPNAFGLTFPPAYSGYAEYCQATDHLRGGGEGLSLSEVNHILAIWLPTAPAYYHWTGDLRRIDLTDVAVRRALSLPL